MVSRAIGCSQCLPAGRSRAMLAIFGMAYGFRRVVGALALTCNTRAIAQPYATAKLEVVAPNGANCATSRDLARAGDAPHSQATVVQLPTPVRAVPHASRDSDRSLATCLPLTPTGCDCLGCCELPAASGWRQASNAAAEGGAR